MVRRRAHTPFDGLPVAHPGGIDVVYDTIARPETLEVGVRVLAERGTLVQSGVSTPGRWEWTPIYFKELTIAGSNAFGIEEVDGVRKHAIAHYLDMAASGRVDLTGMLTHRFPLERMVGRAEGHRPARRERGHQGRFRGILSRSMTTIPREWDRRPRRAPQSGPDPVNTRSAKNGTNGKRAASRGAKVAVVAGEPASKRALRSQGRKTMRKLLDAAMVVFARRGYHAARVDDIVKVARTSHGTFYLYFSNKEDLLRALVGEAGEVVASLDDALGPVGPDAAGWQELRSWMERFSEAWQRYAPVLRAWTDLVMSDTELGAQAHAAAERRGARPGGAHRRGRAPSGHRPQRRGRGGGGDGGPLPRAAAVRRRARRRVGARHPHHHGASGAVRRGPAAGARAVDRAETPTTSPRPRRPSRDGAEPGGYGPVA